MNTHGTFQPHPEQPRPQLRRDLRAKRMAQVIRRVFAQCGTQISMDNTRYMADEGWVSDNWFLN